MEHSFYNLSSESDLFNLLHWLNSSLDSIAFFISTVANLSKFQFKCHLNHNNITQEKTLELITISGTYSSLHISVSDDNCNVY